MELESGTGCLICRGKAYKPTLILISEMAKIYITSYDPEALELFKEMSKSVGHIVEAKPDYEQPEKLPDVSVVDVGLANTEEPFNLINYLNENDIPMYVLTTIPEELLEDKRITRMKELGAGKIVLKPVLADDFLAAIEDLLKKD